MTAGTLVFFFLNALLFWYAFTWRRFPLLPGIFYVWVNCFGIIAPVQAWSFANSLFDTRQAKRLFGLIGSGASLGAITGGILARFLVEPLGGSINLHPGPRRPDPDGRAGRAHREPPDPAKRA